MYHPDKICEHFLCRGPFLKHLQDTLLFFNRFRDMIWISGPASLSPVLGTVRATRFLPQSHKFDRIRPSECGRKLLK
jgi:hypothetical protein